MASFKGPWIPPSQQMAIISTLQQGALVVGFLELSVLGHEAPREVSLFNILIVSSGLLLMQRTQVRILIPNLLFILPKASSSSRTGENNVTPSELITVIPEKGN